MLILRNLLKTVYPDRCLACGEDSQDTGGFCSECSPGVHFISGSVCDLCGLPLPGEADDDALICDDCQRAPPSWHHGRAVALYEGPIRRLILSLKHSDRLDIAGPIAEWMANISDDLVSTESVVLPVPLHWRRFLWRQYNQAALIAEKYSKIRGLEFQPDTLNRIRATRMQKGMSLEKRRENQRGAIRVPDNKSGGIAGRPVILIDDVMTTGATLSACAEACLAVGAVSVNAVVAARVARKE